ncbi:MAG TPA: hypothetical protein VFR47_23070 [Anaerolineales bacterium]|nr:hypothetical protein [Anaerolineales bacterium]
MAKITLHPMFQGVSGRMDGIVFRRSVSGRIYMSLTPDMSRVQWSPAQQAHRQKFRQAIAYARAALADPQLRAHYQERAAQENSRPYDLAVSDAFKGRNLLEK